jgi:hypothetical protein
MSVDHPDELLESLDESNWTLGDRIAFIERLIQLELAGSRRSPFELMLALHQLEDIRMAVYRDHGSSLLSLSGEAQAANKMTGKASTHENENYSTNSSR